MVNLKGNANMSWHYEVLELTEAEAQGLLLAMSWMRELSIHNIIFETNCKMVVDIFQESSHGYSKA